VFDCEGKIFALTKTALLSVYNLNFMYEKFAALAFALFATVHGQDYDVEETTAIEQTPVPDIGDDTLWNLVTIPEDEDFGEFNNNVEYIGVALWGEDEESDIFAWAEENYEENTDYMEPTGDVFAAEIGFLEAFYEGYSIAVGFYADGAEAAYFATSDGFATWSIDAAELPEEDGEIDVASLGWSVESNTDTVEAGAGIGSEFGQALSDDATTWSIWQWNADSESEDFEEGAYDVYVIQTDDTGAQFFFSDELDIAYLGATTMVSAAIASATALYALI
jgi:hypothetical protein